MQLKAQVSLETLLVVSVMIGFLFLLMPSIEKGYSLTVYSFDVKNALEFKEETAFAIKELTEFNSREKTELTIRPINKWLIEIKKNLIKIIVVNKELGERKEIKLYTENELQENNISVEKKSVIEILKENNLIVIQKKPLIE